MFPLTDTTSTFKHYAAGKPSVEIGHSLRAIEFCDEGVAFLSVIWEDPEWNICQDVDYPGLYYSEFLFILSRKFL